MRLSQQLPSTVKSFRENRIHFTNSSSRIAYGDCRAAAASASSHAFGWWLPT